MKTNVIWYIIRKRVLLLIVAMTTLVVSASEPFQLSSVVDKWDAVAMRWWEAKERCDSVNRDICSAAREIDSVDAKIRFIPKAPSLRISEFETDEAFSARVARQRKMDDAEKKEVMQRRESERQRLRTQMVSLAKQADALTNQLNRIAQEWEKFPKGWTYTSTMYASDLPYFDRGTMSFRNISNPFVSHDGKDKRMRFDVTPTIGNVSLKFKQLADAEAFKKGIVSGSIKASFVCTFDIDKPSEYEIEPARTKYKYEADWSYIAVAAIILAMGGSLDGVSGPRLTPVEIPAIKGRAFPVRLSQFKVVLTGSGVKKLGIELVDPSEKWNLVVQ